MTKLKVYEFHSMAVFISHATSKFAKDLDQSNWHDFCTKPSVECFVHSSVNRDGNGARLYWLSTRPEVRMAADIGKSSNSFLPHNIR